MQRREAILALAAIGAMPLGTEAQQSANLARIGLLTSNAARTAHMREAFYQGLRDLGYIEGHNFVTEFRDAGGKLEQLPALAAELVSLKVDVIVVGGTPQAFAAKQATRTIPIVFTTVGDPVGSGLVASLARPGGNVTGLSNLAPELVGKHLDLLKQVVPGVSRVAVLRHPSAVGERTHQDLVKIAESAARALALRLQVVDVRNPAELDMAFAEIAGARFGAVTVLGSTMFFIERQRLVDLAASNRLPAIYAEREFVDAGGLMSYGANDADLLRRAATYVDKILKGAKPSDLPVQQANKFDLMVNLKTAKALGLVIPQSVLLRAEKVIE
jgi:putative ABC transport system substrate-binding protein